MGIHLSDQHDSFIWGLRPDGVFLVKSMYADYMNEHTMFLAKYLWKLKVPLKIKIFMWLLY